MNYINKGKRDILIFPKFNNINEIQKIRKKYDELYKIIMPHITIAFPFNENISNSELKESLKNITKNIKPFKVRCSGITLKKDERINSYYIFLNIVEGKDIIQKIHNQIYKDILPNVNIEKYNYEPHITLGNTDNVNEIIALNDEFETIIDTITVESIGNNEESIIQFEIKLS